MLEAVICFRCARMSSRSNWMSCSLAFLGGAPAPPGMLCGVWASIEMLDTSSALTSTKTANTLLCILSLL